MDDLQLSIDYRAEGKMPESQIAKGEQFTQIRTELLQN